VGRLQNADQEKKHSQSLKGHMTQVEFILYLLAERIKIERKTQRDIT